jgi:hypothetical protein
VVVNIAKKFSSISVVRKKFTVAILVRIGYTLSIKSRKRENMTEFEKQCYGMTEQDIREQYMESITARHAGLEMVVMGILSDAQEMVAVGYSENVRLYLNRAKFILSEMLENKSTQDSDYLDSAAHLDQVE